MTSKTSNGAHVASTKRTPAAKPRHDEQKSIAEEDANAEAAKANREMNREFNGEKQPPVPARNPLGGNPD
jgi:hypothetical protein